MITPRGTRFLLFTAALLALAVQAQNLADFFWPAGHFYFPSASTVTLLALTLLLWFFTEWLLFAFRVRLRIRRLRIRREIRDERGPVETLWAGRPFEVRVEIASPGGLGFPYVTVSDRVPFGAIPFREGMEVGDRYEGALEGTAPVGFGYRLHCPHVGRVRFEGVTLRTADLQGFFYHTAFLPLVAVYRVLPPPAELGGHGPTVKRHNLLLPPGVHRHRRPGSGTELLDLRDYRPGDPPKTIAWKVSARRDRLITKEFESEVPVRCTLFVDTSDSVRLGPPGQNALTRLVEIAAAVARAATDNRDLTGLCRFDERGSSTVRPARGGRHLARLLNLLAELGGLAPAEGRVDVGPLLPLAYGFAQEVYPEMMRPDRNRFPAWVAWLWPPPVYTRQRPTAGDYFYPWLPYLLLVYAAAGLGALALALLALAGGLEDVPLGAVLILLGAVVLVATVILLRVPSALFFPRRRRALRWRKQLAALFSVTYRLAPGGLATLLEDDERFGFYLQRFLADHQVPHPLALYDAAGKYLYAAPGKVQVLADALLRAVGKGHDNELFVLLADLLELADQLEPLLRAVKVALARHHRVLLICPWPPGIAVPERRRTVAAWQRMSDRPRASGGAPRADHPDALPPPRPPRPGLRSVLQQTTTARFHSAYHRLCQTFARLGVPVVCAQGGDPPRLILERLDMLREMGRKP